MFGDFHLESQRCLSLQSLGVLGRLSTRRWAFTQDAPTHVPTWLPRHTYILLPFRPNFPHPLGPAGRRGRMAISILLTKRGKVSKQVCLRGIDPDILSVSSWNFGLHSVQPISGTRCVFFELVLVFWSWCNYCKDANLSCLGTPHQLDEGW